MAEKDELCEYRDEDLAEALAEIEAELVEPEKPKKALPERTLLVITKVHEELRAITLEQVLDALYPDDDESLCLRCKYIISKIFEEAEEEIAKSKQQPPEPAPPKKRPMLPSRREKYQKEREEMKKKREDAKVTVLEYMDTCKPLEDDKDKKEKEINHNDTPKPCIVPCDKINVPFCPNFLRKFWANFVLEPIKEEDGSIQLPVMKDTSGHKVEEPFIEEDNNIPIVDDFIEEKQEIKGNSFIRNLQSSAVMKALRKKKGKKILVNTVTQSEC